VSLASLRQVRNAEGVRSALNTRVLINSIVQQTMVFVAQLATAGGVRAPLAQTARLTTMPPMDHPTMMGKQRP
jgi:hypothetical protein